MAEQNHHSFRDKLLSQEQSNSRFRQQFQLEAKKMYTEKLKIRQRIAYVLTSLLISVITLGFWAFSKMFEEMQIKYELRYAEPLRLASTWAMLLCILLVGLSLWPAIRGKVGLRLYPKAVRFIFCLLILAITLLSFAIVDFLNNETDFHLSDSAIDVAGAAITTVLFIVMSVYLLLSGRIDRGGLENKAKMLELEYRLAELEEKLASGQES